mgnify:CR=1 FL=1
MDVQGCFSFIDQVDLFSQCFFGADRAVKNIFCLQFQVADAIRINQYGLSFFRGYVSFDT